MTEWLEPLKLGQLLARASRTRVVIVCADAQGAKNLRSEVYRLRQAILQQEEPVPICLSILFSNISCAVCDHNLLLHPKMSKFEAIFSAATETDVVRPEHHIPRRS